MNTLNKRPGKKTNSIYVSKQVTGRPMPTDTEPTSATTLSTSHILNK